MNEGVLVSASTVARRLGQAKASIYKLAKMGHIPSYAAGPRLTGRRFDVEEVREVLRRVAEERAAKR
jgi:hypothetical protein